MLGDKKAIFHEFAPALVVIIVASPVLLTFFSHQNPKLPGKYIRDEDGAPEGYIYRPGS
jgi:hypothetical protein